MSALAGWAPLQVSGIGDRRQEAEGGAGKSKLGKDTARGSRMDVCKLATVPCVIERTGIRGKKWIMENKTCECPLRVENKGAILPQTNY